jgi:3-hydroxy-3-methylglutaryl CoA synthase
VGTVEYFSEQMGNMIGLIDLATYVPRCSLTLADVTTTLGQGGGRGARRVANFDEDTTTMGVEAARRLEITAREAAKSLWFASSSPAYGIKTNASAIHAALQLSSDVASFDVGLSIRSSIGALRAASLSAGIAVCSDMWSGPPGGDDERLGGDGAFACVFGDESESIAVIEGWHSLSMEILERLAAPGALMQSWDDRFGSEALAEALSAFLSSVVVSTPDKVVVSGANQRSATLLRSCFSVSVVATPTDTGFTGVADFGLQLAEALHTSIAGQQIAAFLIGDGVQAVFFRVTDRIERWKKSKRSVSATPRNPVRYADVLSWRGALARQMPRRPEPQQPAAPPSFRNVGWKFGLVAGQCSSCGHIHTPPEPRCRGCGSIEQLVDVPLADSDGTIVTFTVDHLAYSPASPLLIAVVDFGNGARSSFEVADS